MTTLYIFWLEAGVLLRTYYFLCKGLPTLGNSGLINKSLSLACRAIELSCDLCDVCNDGNKNVCFDPVRGRSSVVGKKRAGVLTNEGGRTLHFKQTLKLKTLNRINPEATATS